MRQQKRVVVLAPDEYKLMLRGLVHWRNKLVEQGRYTDALDELLIKLQKTRRKFFCGR